MFGGHSDLPLPSVSVMRTPRLAFTDGHSTGSRCSPARVHPAVTPAQTANTTQGGGACVVAGAVRGYLVNDPG